MKTFKHSGTFGDIIYGLSLVKQLGGGKLYLQLDNINRITQHYYGTLPNPFHRGRMTESDYEFMKEFMLCQNYIEDFAIWNSVTDKITDDLDLFRPLFVRHPGNYVDVFADVWQINDPGARHTMRNQAWLTVTNPKRIPGKDQIINRTSRWIQPNLNPIYNDLRDQGAETTALFVGLESEYEKFKTDTGWNIDYYPTRTMLELAEIIAGADQFIGNQSMALSLAIGLGVPFACELRRDLPLERNECYFPEHPNGEYF